jgi:hypothetical protein
VNAERRANAAFWAAVPLAAIVWYVVGRHQWFIRDDWAFLITREKMRVVEGYDAMLLNPQDGHWMTPAILVFRFLRWTVGYRSYWPYLAVLLASHLAIVLCVRLLCRRFGVTPWTTTLICAVLLVFGFGWENLLFAVQITYTFSLLAFLAQILLTDHDGPVDHRDWIGSAIALVGVMSSGFGPFFIAGIAVLLGLRRRWRALLVAVVPQGVAYTWWWLFWGSDRAADEAGRHYRQAPRFAAKGLMQTFGGLTGTLWLAGGAAVLTAGVIVWRRVDWNRRTAMIALASTAVVMYVGIGIERAGIGLQFATQSRYAYMAAMMLAPIFAVGLDQAPRFAPWAIWVPRLLLLFAVGRNIVALRDDGNAWGARDQAERRLIALIAGSPRAGEADFRLSPLPDTPDVHVGDIPGVVARHGVTPRRPSTPQEIAEVQRVLQLSPAPSPP